MATQGSSGKIGTAAMVASRPRKGWFQVRLTTCIVMMLGAGVMLWANVVPSEEYIGVGLAWGYYALNRGWPYWFWRGLRDHADRPAHWDWWGLVMDAVIGLVLLFLLGVLCEWWLRAKDRKRKEIKRRQEGPRPPSATGARYDLP